MFHRLRYAARVACHFKINDSSIRMIVKKKKEKKIHKAIIAAIGSIDTLKSGSTLPVRDCLLNLFWYWTMPLITPWKESYDQLRQHIKKRRHFFANKGPSSQGYGFSSGQVWM